MFNLSRYKIVNLALLVVTLTITIYAFYRLGIPCPEGKTIECLYETKFSILQPLYSGGFVLSIILAFLLLVPANLFRKWLWYIFPVSLVATVYFVSEVSVYSSGVLSTTRGAAAELSMQFFAVVTLLFVLGHLSYGYIKQRRNRSKT